MKILYITPENPFIVTPETGFARDLAKLGHGVTLLLATNGFNHEILDGDYDIIVGAMEYSMALANLIGKLLNKPVYNHMEWVPPWRIKLEPLDKWGYEDSTIDKMDEQKFEFYKGLYKQQVLEWEKATIRSCAGKCLIRTIEPFATKSIDCEVKYYSINSEKLEQYRDDTIKEKYQIISTARLVPHKRIVHVVRALSKLKNPPHYVIVGYGYEQKQIQDEADSLGISIEFVGPGDNGIKERKIQESLFSVNIWAGIPIAESFYYGKPGITYSEDHMVEVFGDSVLYAKPNDINDLAKKIQYYLDNESERKAMGVRGRELMTTNKINMGTQKRLAEDVEQILLKGIERWKKENE